MTGLLLDKQSRERHTCLRGGGEGGKGFTTRDISSDASGSTTQSVAKLQTADVMIGWNTLSPTFARRRDVLSNPTYGLGGINRYVGGFYFSLFRAARAVRHQIQFRAPPGRTSRFRAAERNPLIDDDDDEGSEKKTSRLRLI